LFDERVFVGGVGLNREIMTRALEYICVKEMAIPTVDPEKFRKIDDILQIYSIMTSLSTRDRKFLNSKMDEYFGKYNLTVKIPAKCPICTQETETEVSMLSELFRLSR
jgi:hypothetical protein